MSQLLYKLVCQRKGLAGLFAFNNERQTTLLDKMNFSVEGKSGFYIVTLSKLLNDRAFEISIRAFLRFYHSLTPKHKKKVFFLAIDPSKERSELLAKHASRLEQPHQVLFGLSSAQSDDVDDVRLQESILMNINAQISEYARIELLSMCLPILTFDSWEKAHSFDQAACVFLETGLEEQAIHEFGNLIRMLYFDPGALKMLRHKAMKHRRSTSLIMATVA